jgi:hypothetical protein
VPSQTRVVQRRPPGRSPSKKVSQSGTVATTSDATPLAMRVSAHITRPLPPASSRTPISA